MDCRKAPVGKGGKGGGKGGGKFGGGKGSGEFGGSGKGLNEVGTGKGESYDSASAMSSAQYGNLAAMAEFPGYCYACGEWGHTSRFCGKYVNPGTGAEQRPLASVVTEKGPNGPAQAQAERPI